LGQEHPIRPNTGLPPLRPNFTPPARALTSRPGPRLSPSHVRRIVTRWWDLPVISIPSPFFVVSIPIRVNNPDSVRVALPCFARVDHVLDSGGSGGIKAGAPRPILHSQPPQVKPRAVVALESLVGLGVRPPCRFTRRPRVRALQSPVITPLQRSPSSRLRGAPFNF
jgi:hypothetical protein